MMSQRRSKKAFLIEKVIEAWALVTNKAWYV